MSRYYFSIFLHFENLPNLKLKKICKLFQIIVQTCVICGFIFATAGIYTKMQLFGSGAVLVVIAQIAWQSFHGAVVFVYLFINRSMKSEFLKLMRLDKRKVGSSAISKTKSSDVTGGEIEEEGESVY